MGNVYKYLRSDLFDLIFPGKRKQVVLKASHPAEFNDPYELFLSIDSAEAPEEILAYYQEIVSALPALPTVCFSRAPDVVPMWAHYGRESTGFVIELDEQKVLAELKEPLMGDVDYSETATVIDSQEVAHAFMTGKPRHTYFIQSAAFRAAYFTKSQYWSYERERRLVIQGKDLGNQNGLYLLRLPLKCVSSIIVGAKADPKFRRKVREWTRRTGVGYFEMRIGRSSMKPFFFARNKKTYQFTSNAIVLVDKVCEGCGEPLDTSEVSRCHWCATNEKLRAMAASRNPMRLLSSLGMLENYTREMDEIGRGAKDSKNRTNQVS